MSCHDCLQLFCDGTHYWWLSLAGGRCFVARSTPFSCPFYSASIAHRPPNIVMCLTHFQPLGFSLKGEILLYTVLSALSIPFTMDSMFPILPIHFHPITYSLVIPFCNLSILCLSSVLLSILSLRSSSFLWEPYKLPSSFQL